MSEHRYRAIVWLVFTSLTMVLPISVGLFLLGALKDASVTLGGFTDGGQFAVFTSTLLIETIYLVLKPSSLRLAFTEHLGFLSIGGIFISTTLFVIALLNAGGSDIDLRWLQWPSIVITVGALVIAFLAVENDEKRAAFDPRRMAREQQDDLAQQFRAIQK